MADITPQFGTAEYSNRPETERCSLCQQSVGTSYYRLNSKMVCSSCAQKAKSGLPIESKSAYLKALLYGSVAALAGFILYSTVGIATGLEIGYVSLAVGFLVGAGMKKGAGGVGGRKYQVTAALLTYAAVSVSAIPIYMYMERSQAKHPQQMVQQTRDGAQDSSAAERSGDNAAPPKKSAMSFGAAIGMLLLIGLASPFLSLSGGVSGVIGLVILFVGMRFAWKQTAAHVLALDGPFDNAPAKSAGVAGNQ
jgi:hypothetical protein